MTLVFATLYTATSFGSEEFIHCCQAVLSSDSASVICRTQSCWWGRSVFDWLCVNMRC